MSKLEKVEGWAVLRHQGFDATADIKQQMHKTSLFRVPDEPIYVEYKNKYGELIKGYIYEFRIDMDLKTSKSGWKMYRSVVIRALEHNLDYSIHIGKGIDAVKIPSKLKPKSPKFIQDFNAK
jgi:hypothetical protein